MIGGLVVLASLGISGGGTFGNFLSNLENLGFFSYVLPFLLIFAIVYAILSKTELLGKNNGVHLILSLAIGLMALQFNFVSYFFAQIFPRLGVLLSIVLTLIIVLAFFPTKDKNGKDVSWPKYLLGGLGLIGVIVIVAQSFSNSFGWSDWGIFNGDFSFFFQQYGTTIIVLLVVVGFIALAFFNNPNRETSPKKEKKPSS